MKQYIQVILLFVMVSFLVILLLSETKDSYLAGRRDQIRYQMRVIGQGFQKYYHQHGCMPPVLISDSNGIPTHSWRALLLPYVEFKKSKIDYHFAEPWNSNHNQEVAVQNQDLYSRILDSDQFNGIKNTKLVAVVDDSTIWSQFRTCPFQGDFNDGEKYVVLIEIPNPGGLWNEPADISLEDLIEMIKNSTFSQQGMHVLFSDGEVKWLAPKEITVLNLLNFLQVNDPKKVAGI